MVKILVLGAHPDDAEVYAGGLLVRQCQLGATVRIVSVTDGSSGHQSIAPEKLKKIRRVEAKAAGERIGAEYVTWDFRDGYLEPNTQVREAIIAEIRQFGPDLVLTHRTNDYHPDHRAVGTAVQDASYLVTVPNVCRATPALGQDPVVAYMCDMFSRPNRLRVDIAIDIGPEFDKAISMAACHESQFFDWLAHHDGLLHEVPESPEERHRWLSGRFIELHQQRLAFFRRELSTLALSGDPPKVELFEVSEYAGKLAPDSRKQLFPGNLVPE
ncbi:MAG: PIG-L family deacetylase [Planctomycetota bacterium]